MLYEYLVTGFSHEVQMHSLADVKCTDEKETATTTVKQIDLSLYYINALKGTQYRPAAAGQSAVKQAYVHGKTAAVYVAVKLPKLPRYKHTAAYGPVKSTPAVQCDHGKNKRQLGRDKKLGDDHTQATVLRRCSVQSSIQRRPECTTFVPQTSDPRQQPSRHGLGLGTGAGCTRW